MIERDIFSGWSGTFGGYASALNQKPTAGAVMRQEGTAPEVCQTGAQDGDYASDADSAAAFMDPVLKP